MNRPGFMALALAAALSVSHAACAAGEEGLQELREQVRQLRLEYERRIAALERQLQQAEGAARRAESAARSAAATAGNAESVANQAAVQANSRPSGENAFNPAVSLVLNGTYSNLSRDPGRYRIDGFMPTNGGVAPPKRGLSLGESEIAFGANVDHLFRGTLIASVSPEDSSIGIEEGYVQTLGLSNGLTIKAGRFYSAVGYQNQIHAHAWDFADVPLANKVFLGGQFNDDGIQLKWIAPTDTYLDLGLELGRGRRFPGGPDGGRDKNGVGSGNVFIHLGGDIDASTAWQAGLSHLRMSPQDRSYTDVDSTGAGVTNSFSGTSRLWALSGVLKWAPNGNSTVRSLKLQGEYFRRSEEGSLVYDANAASLGAQSGTLATRQSGWYVQGVYQFIPQWRIGYRYDRLSSGASSLGLRNVGRLSAADFPILSAYNPSRQTLMADWSASEFSRVRLQFARDYSRAGAADNQVLLQYIMSLGAHGAHNF